MSDRFTEAEAAARARGCRLCRAGEPGARGCAKTGYVLWLPRRTWVRLGTLDAVFDRLRKLPVTETEAQAAGAAQRPEGEGASGATG